jgi:lipopolysaccharide/colanic/teichoic acid biosynthesis glycosyltransferase
MSIRVCEMLFALLGLVILSPVMVLSMLLVWLQDFCSPLYISSRMGYGGRPFRMIKLRSMTKDADRLGVDSTSSGDPRITAIGHFMRRYKIDEFFQLWNVLLGHMSFVGPRPNVKRETDLYTKEERRLFDVKPGITDFASIVFADEGEILKNYSDADIAYNQFIRPWKSRLGLLYIANKTVCLDCKIVGLTLLVILSRSIALRMTCKILRDLGCDDKTLLMATRTGPLIPFPPPGGDGIVMSRTPMPQRQ